jgi:hypothetical protein
MATKKLFIIIKKIYLFKIVILAGVRGQSGGVPAQAELVLEVGGDPQHQRLDPHPGDGEAATLSTRNPFLYALISPVSRRKDLSLRSDFM